MKNTSNQFKEIIAQCRDLYTKKLVDYGAAWRVLRLPSLTDQIFIKVSRIRTLQEATERLVDEGEESEFIGIINYSIMALVQLELGFANQPDLTTDQATEFYDKYATIAHDLMIKKNHDYGEAWRDMRVSSITDLIYQKSIFPKRATYFSCRRVAISCRLATATLNRALFSSSPMRNRGG